MILTYAMTMLLLVILLVCARNEQINRRVLTLYRSQLEARWDGEEPCPTCEGRGASVVVTAHQRLWVGRVLAVGSSAGLLWLLTF